VEKNDELKSPDVVLVQAAYIAKDTMSSFLKALFNQVQTETLETLKVVFYDMTWMQVQELIRASVANKSDVQEPFTMHEAQDTRGTPRIRYVVTVLPPSTGLDAKAVWGKLLDAPARFGVDATSDLSITAGSMSNYRHIGMAEFLRRRVVPGTVVWIFNESKEFTAVAAALALGCRCIIVCVCVCAHGCVCARRGCACVCVCVCVLCACVRV
jgi:hypothetical protein